MARSSGKGGKGGKGGKAEIVKHRNEKLVSSPKKYYGMLVAITVVVVAHLWEFLLFSSSGSASSSSSGEVNVDALKPLEKLMHYWPSGGAVTVASVVGDEADGDSFRGLVATRKIERGQVSLNADYHDLAGELTSQQPQLVNVVESLLQAAIQEQQATLATLSTGTVLALVRFLQLVDIEKVPKWTVYADTLPQNVTSMAWYWTPEERNCMVPRPNDALAWQNLSVFREVMTKLMEGQPWIQRIIRDPQRAEWAYLMFTTRAFEDLFFVPILDMGNHDPLKAVNTFFAKEQKKILLVAPYTIQKGDPVYSTYGSLTPVHSAEIYGFVQAEPSYFEVPSIHEDLRTSESTKNIGQCANPSVKFFGDVGDQEIYAQLGGEGGHKSVVTHFQAFMPNEWAHACIRRLIPSDNKTDMAKYIAQKLESDHQQYVTMAHAPECQSTEGNFPLIRRANQVTAKLMWDAKGAWEQAADKGTNTNIP